jgi:hypothetical protein
MNAYTRYFFKELNKDHFLMELINKYYLKFSKVDKESCLLVNLKAPSSAMIHNGHLILI